MSIFGRALFVASGRPPGQPPPPAWGRMACSRCVVLWTGGPACWVCGQPGYRWCGVWQVAR